MNIGAVRAGACAHGVVTGVADVFGIAGRQRRVRKRPGVGDACVAQQVRVGFEIAIRQRLVAGRSVAISHALGQHEQIGQRAEGQHLVGGRITRQQGLRRPAQPAGIGSIDARREAWVPLRPGQRQVDRLTGRIGRQAAVVHVVVAVQTGGDVAPRVAAVGGTDDAGLGLHGGAFDLPVHGPYGVIRSKAGRDGQAVVRARRAAPLPGGAAVGGALQRPVAGHEQRVVHRVVGRDGQPIGVKIAGLAAGGQPGVPAVGGTIYLRLAEVGAGQEQCPVAGIGGRHGQVLHRRALPDCLPRGAVVCGAQHAAARRLDDVGQQEQGVVCGIGRRGHDFGRVADDSGRPRAQHSPALTRVAAAVDASGRRGKQRVVGREGRGGRKRIDGGVIWRGKRLPGRGEQRGRLSVGHCGRGRERERHHGAEQEKIAHFHQRPPLLRQ